MFVDLPQESRHKQSTVPLLPWHIADACFASGICMTSLSIDVCWMKSLAAVRPAACENGALGFPLMALNLAIEIETAYTQPLILHYHFTCFRSHIYNLDVQTRARISVLCHRPKRRRTDSTNKTASCKLFIGLQETELHTCYQALMFHNHLARCWHNSHRTSSRKKYSAARRVKVMQALLLYRLISVQCASQAHWLSHGYRS